MVGCTGAVLGRGEDLGAYVVISGPVDPAVAIGGGRTGARIAWAWLAGGELSSLVTEVPFEPRVYSYALSVEVPPDPDEATVALASDQGEPGLTLLFGVPLLVEPDGRGAPVVAVDPERLLEWVSGASPTLAEAFTTSGGAVAAVTPDHLLVLVSAQSGSGRLATAPEWQPEAELCRVDAALAGLTLYRSVGVGCSGWDPLAPAGRRTEFQGVAMGPVP